MNRGTSNIAEMIDTLTPDQIAQVQIFVESIQFSGTRTVNASFSDPVFGAIWNNPEDDAYDTA